MASRFRHARLCRLPILFVVAGFGAAAAAGSLAQPAPGLPAAAGSWEVYGRLPRVEDVALSPSGSRIAFVQTTQDDRYVVIETLDSKAPARLLRAGDQKLRAIQWADDDHLMIETSDARLPFGLIGQRQEWLILQVYEISTGRLAVVPQVQEHRMGNALETMNVISGDPMIRYIGGHTVLFLPGIYLEDRTLPALFRVDLRSGAQVLYRRGTAATIGWLVDAQGQVVAQQDYAEGAQRWSIEAVHGSDLQPLASGHAAVDLPALIGFGPHARTLLLQGSDRDDGRLRLLPLSGGPAGSAPIPEGADAILDPLSGRLIGAVYEPDDPHYQFLDPAIQTRWDAVVRYYSGSRLRLVSHSEDFMRMVVLVDGPQDGYAYVLIDLRAHRSDLIAAVYPGVSPLPVRKITYRARDGLEIPAYLTLPRRKPARNLPLIVLPHGGPQARDTGWFDWWAQALAAQGYAVLQPNYRGSALGWRFLSAGFGQWGRKMETDLSDGVHDLVRRGIADPARVCIVGGSYGGYAALAGVTLEPRVYRCAVAVAGISDIKTFLEWINIGHLYGGDEIDQRYMDRFLGVTGADDPALAAISPIDHIADVQAPVLLIHGREDTVVPYEQSREMYRALRAAHKPVEFVTLDQEDHWLSRSRTRLQMLEATVKFLRTNDPPDLPRSARAVH